MPDAANIAGALHIDRYLSKPKMPYARNSDLPDSVRNALPGAAQTRFRQVVNEALGNDRSDSQAFASAWSVIRNGWKKPKDGAKWVRIKKDAKPLFLSRKLENAGDVIDWAKGQGFDTTLQPGDMHATIAYSKEPFDWPTPAVDTVTVHGPEGRSLKQFGDATVLAFDSPTLKSRWQEMLNSGASWDHDGFTPHVTLTWQKNGVDPTAVEPYSGPLVFGPEVLKELDPNWSPETIVEKSLHLPTRPGTFAVYEFLNGFGNPVWAYISKREDGSYYGDTGKFDFARSSAEAMHKYLEMRSAEFIIFTEKFNPNHDELGRFTTGGGGGSISAGFEEAGQISGGGGSTSTDYGVTPSGEMKDYTAQPANSAAELFQHTYDPNVTVDQAVALTGAAPRIAEAEANLAAARAEEQRTGIPADTQKRYSDGNGLYVPERQALHDRLLDETFTDDQIARALPTDGEQPTLYVLGGRAGAGKSWFSGPDSPFNEDATVNINTDTFKEKLPEYQGWNANFTHEESSDIATRAHERARSSGLNVTYDATLRSPGGIGKVVADYIAAGYRVEGYFMHTAPQVSVVRALNRFAKPNPGQPLGPKNRYVPPEYVLNSTGNEKTFDSLIPKFAKYAIYDNNAGGGPKRVKSG